jgi:Xaa-Pro aminopeptidase
VLLGLQALLPSARFHDATPLVSRLRIRKDETEIAVLSDLASRFDAVWKAFFAEGRLIGVTENAVARQLRELVASQGFDAMLWCDVGSGPNGASPLHHGSERVVRRGDPVVIDFAATKDGYIMDTCRTPVAGDPPAGFVEAYDLVNRAYEAAAAAIRPGATAESIDRVARDLIARGGHDGRFIHRLGHGLGLDAHEEPYIVAGNAMALRPGMVFSNEPGIYIPGQWGIRTENIMLVTEDGGRPLADTPRTLVSMS